MHHPVDPTAVTFTGAKAIRYIDIALEKFHEEVLENLHEDKSGYMSTKDGFDLNDLSFISALRTDCLQALKNET